MASECYQAINIVLSKQSLGRFVMNLRAFAKVSRSGYYAWLARTDSVSLREERDYADYLLLKRVHDLHKGKSAIVVFTKRCLILLGDR